MYAGIEIDHVDEATGGGYGQSGGAGGSPASAGLRVPTAGQDAKETAEAISDALLRFVVRHPMHAMASAAGLGLLAGLVLKRR
ncbi:MAG TPA: hypothetical protein VGN88_10545 [Phycisphaerae bacterium]|jgi:hypothetical protein